MGAVFTQQPQLFKAIICSVPLLDMLRFHKLLAGSSWIGEYGNPEIPEEYEFLARYSPYHNLKKDVQYPRVFFNTSTKDDRVHPAHARKMVAKMEEMGHPYFYYENTNGGHGGAANLEEIAYRTALEYIYLIQELNFLD